MIDFIRQTPSAYSKESRDYQLISRIYAVLFNYCRMCADNMNIWEQSIDERLVDLRARTVNFRPKHVWNKDTLAGVTSCFKYLVRYKGTEKAIKICINILLRLKGYTNTGGMDISIENNCVIVKLGNQISNSGIIDDLFYYILPVGMTYRVIEHKYISGDTNIGVGDTVDIEYIDDEDLGIYLPSSLQSSENEGDTLYHNAINGEV